MKPMTTKGLNTVMGKQMFTIGGKPRKKERQRRELEALREQAEVERRHRKHGV